MVRRNTTNLTTIRNHTQPTTPPPLSPPNSSPNSPSSSLSRARNSAAGSPSPAKAASSPPKRSSAMLKIRMQARGKGRTRILKEAAADQRFFSMMHCGMCRLRHFRRRTTWLSSRKWWVFCYSFPWFSQLYGRTNTWLLIYLWFFKQTSLILAGLGIAGAAVAG